MVPGACHPILTQDSSAFMVFGFYPPAATGSEQGSQQIKQSKSDVVICVDLANVSNI
jgi:hypothetical protein